MTGRIAGLAASTRTGTIRAQDGARFVFDFTAFLGDFDSLAVGHRVSFVIKREQSFTAVDVFREPVPARVPVKKLGESQNLRYTGFQQSANVRTYSFDELTSMDSVRHCVTVDIALLLKHHIGVQEGPALCLRKLVSDLKDSADSGRHQLRDEDLLALVASRAGASKRRRSRHPVPGRRGWPPPALVHSGSQS